VLDRVLSPLEHTAIDLALQDAVRSSEVPILPMVVDRILTPKTAASSDTHSAASSQATSQDSSTDHRPSSSTRHSRWSAWTCRGWRRTAR
jgi:hypothetical protein